jgi:hypothetical protein
MASWSETRLTASAAAAIPASAVVPVREVLRTMTENPLLGRLWCTPVTVLGIGVALNAPWVDSRRSLGVDGSTPSVRVAP